MSASMTILLKSRRFLNLRIERANNAGSSVYHELLNLKQKSPLFVKDFYRCMSVPNLRIPETDVNKFLNNLVEDYTSGKNTYFGEMLKFESINNLINERIQILETISNLSQLAEEDKEFKKLAEEESITYKNKLALINNDLIDLVIEYLNQDKCNDIIFEISAGVGGQESMLFVKDLLDMYLKHITYLGYSSEIIHLDDNAVGGIRYVSIMISGKNCFQKLIYEAGIHRVQRVPATEKSGRVHTSVVAVVVLPQPSDIQVVINPADLKIDTMRASGAGGQHVNTTDSAVRITHLPTKLVAESQVHRSQLKNRELALLKLKAKIYDEQLDKEQKSISGMRKQQRGKRERNEKIRTYNFIQDRITDHRLSDGTLHNLKGFLSGGKILDNLHDKLEEQSKLKLLYELIHKM